MLNGLKLRSLRLLAGAFGALFCLGGDLERLSYGELERERLRLLDRYLLRLDACCCPPSLVTGATGRWWLGSGDLLRDAVDIVDTDLEDGDLLLLFLDLCRLLSLSPEFALSVAIFANCSSAAPFLLIVSRVLTSMTETETVLLKRVQCIVRKLRD